MHTSSMSWFRKSKPKLEEPHVLHVEATGREGDRLIVIGRYHRYGSFGDKRYIQEFGPDGSLVSERRIGKKEAYWRSNEYLSQGVANLGNYLSHIKIYQLSPERLETESGKRVELVSTGNSDEFLEASDDYVLVAPDKSLSLLYDDVKVALPKNTLLRWMAHQLGADALVLYQAGSPARATPVRFRDH